MNFLAFLDKYNPIIRRFVVWPVLMAPIYLAIYLFSRFKKHEIEKHMMEFKNVSIENNRRGTIKVLSYLILTLFILLASITSPAWLK
jgi:hypothetical protein